ETLTFAGALVTQKTAGVQPELTPLQLKAIPYFAWANRGSDNMTVWLPEEVSAARPVLPPTIASTSKISHSEGLKGDPAGIADQWLPANSADKENPFVHWWPHAGTTEWLQYDFEKTETVSTVRVYWFDDEDLGGGCRIPESWRVLYLNGEEWQPVFHAGGFTTTKDGWDEARFAPVTTTALRLEIQCREGVSAGVQEWEVR
ncbi:MAG: discoidin domain-containing protein, partial [Saprospiraceae bacterium]